MKLENKAFENYCISVSGNSTVDLSQSIIIMKFEIDDSLKEYVNQIVNNITECGIVDLTNNFKFWYYINKSVLLLRLNDSLMKRYVIQQLIYKKFTRHDSTVDDSDSPLTIAIDSMEAITDELLHLLFSYRLLVNVIPSLLSHGRRDKALSFVSYVRQTGCLNIFQVANMRRLGLLYDMTSKEFSFDDYHAISTIPEFKSQIEAENNSLLSNGFTPAGLILTDIVAEYVFGSNEEYDYWLPEDNRIMHVKELVVDGDITGLGNITANGEMSAGGAGVETEGVYEEDV